ncbi:hypothetical protein PTTW11_07834 [Pyrenophora teres f. teres]|uniref:Uncharacterized protein n=1 Tax=Pyrenophora teres f. teres TaxID=97479 RepID=A0A6S6WC58_9PLEO|nr:hypothetical protein PTTW11_07834 [Pyrenophora teres f. teres]
MQFSTLTILACFAFSAAAMPQSNAEPQNVVVPATCGTKRRNINICCCYKDSPGCVCPKGCYVGGNPPGQPGPYPTCIL